MVIHAGHWLGDGHLSSAVRLYHDSLPIRSGCRPTAGISLAVVPGKYDTLWWGSQAQAGAGGGEGQSLCGQDGLAADRAHAVARIRLSSQQYRAVSNCRRSRVLERGAHLSRMNRIDSRVTVEDREQHGGRGDPSYDPMVRRIGQEPSELDWIGCGSVLIDPELAEPVPLIADHVQQRGSAQGRCEQLRTLSKSGSNQQATV